MNRLVGEYAYLVKNIKKDGTVILNWNNERVRGLKKYTKAKTLYFGKNCPECDGEINSIKEEVWGMKALMRYENEERELEIKRFGEHHAVSNLIAWMIEEELK
jgi:UDP-N-acetylmuramate-alanine ligase